MIDELLVEEFGELARQKLASVIGVERTDHAFLFSRATAEAGVELSDKVADAR